MPKRRHASVDSRMHPRLTLPAMYTLARVRQEGDDRYRWTGYIYDISESGMRIELDEALPAGATIEVRALLPGQQQIAICASATVVRQHDEPGEPGPVRMGVAFTRFAHHADRARLHAYLAGRGVGAPVRHAA